jgi:hypothetical protein
VYRILVGKILGKRPLRSPRSTWEDNIKLDLKDVDDDGRWMELAQNRVQW